MAELTESPVCVWTRMPDESSRAHQAAALYFQMRASRSLVAVARTLGKNSSLIERWSKQWGWVDRATAYDAHLATEEQKAIEKQATERAAEWQRRADELSEQNYQIGQKIRNKADKMLDFPLTTRTHADGKTTINPARWGYRDLAPMLTLARKLMQEAIQQAVGEGGDETDENWIIEDYKEPA